MKKTIFLICLLTCLALVLPISVIGFSLGTAPQFDETFLGEMSAKMERLESIESPKITVIGGSSVAFGLRSDLMEEQLGMPVVNFGLYASLGTKIMLDMSKANIGEGDIIVIAPEQDAQTLSTYFNADSAWKAFDGNFEYLKYVDKSDLPAMAGGLLSFAGEKYRYYSAGAKPAVTGVYTKEAFNEYTDIEYERPSNTMFGGYDGNNVISFDCSIIEDDFIEYLNQYAEYARDKGASVYFSFSPMNKEALKEGTESGDIYEYFKYLQDSLDFPVISNPEVYLMDSVWFYDSNFHMNNAGAVLHTKHLINDIILAAGLDKVCTIEDPEAPEESVNGDNDVTVEEKELFVIGENEKGIQILGLTEYGALQTDIEIPQSIDSKTVVAIGEGAFSSNTVLKSLKVNEGMIYIANGAFEGCMSLERLIINLSEPQQLRVDEEMLAGAENCTVYIPSGTYGAFSNDYYWAFFCDLGVVEELQ